MREEYLLLLANELDHLHSDSFVARCCAESVLRGCHEAKGVQFQQIFLRASKSHRDQSFLPPLDARLDLWGSGPLRYDVRNGGPIQRHCALEAILLLQ